ncbi:hypothetical protein GEMRC1_011041 [Eukaryota sp. GEM-RC1]
MLKCNKGLLVLNFDKSLFNAITMKKFCDGLRYNSVIRFVILKSLGVELLLVIYEAQLTGRHSPFTSINFDCSPHSIDLSLGLIHFNYQVSSNDLVALSTALKSKVSINRVEFPQHVYSSPDIKSLIALFEIHSINPSVVDPPILPHCIDIEKGIFCFSPKCSFDSSFSKEDVSVLDSF